MRFGFKMPHHSTTWTTVRDVWRAADQLDVFESGWVYDHLVGLRPADGEIVLDPETPILEGWSLLAALACETRRVRLGNLVTCVPFRHPAVLAKIVETVDQISGGRLELGLGAGWMDAEAEMFGIELGTPSDRLDRLEESIEIITALGAGRTVDHDGRFYRLRSARTRPAGGTRPGLWIGGNGERRTLRLVARYADAWNYTALRPDGALEAFRAKREVLVERCAEVGRESSDVVVSVQLHAPVDPGPLLDQLPEWADAGAEYVIFMLPVSATPDWVAALAGALDDFRER